MERFECNLEDILPKLDSVKGNVTRFIRRNFREGNDFIVKTLIDTKGMYGGQNKKLYYLSKQTAELVQSSFKLRYNDVCKVGDTKVHNVIISVETSCLGILCKSLRTLPVHFKRQYLVGKYRVDLYIPELNLCVECDEFGHKHYDTEKENERYSYIKGTLNCDFIRFNPNEPDFDITDIISSVLKRFLESYNLSETAPTSNVHKVQITP
jgi:very-short-patch-repair endonuclease